MGARIAAFSAVHPGLVSAPALVRSDLAMRRFLPLLYRFTGFLAAGGRIAREQGWLRPRAVLSDAQRPSARHTRPLLEAMASPLRPTRNLLQDSLRAMRDFPDRMREHVVTGMRDLPDFDLDTGLLAPCPGRDVSSAIAVGALDAA